MEVPFAVFLERWWVLICRVDFWFKWVSLPLERSSTVLLTWAVNIWRHVRIFNDVVDLKDVGLFNWNDKPNFPLYIGKPTAASEPMTTVTAVDSSFNNYSGGLISYPEHSHFTTVLYRSFYHPHAYASTHAHTRSLLSTLHKSANWTLECCIPYIRDITVSALPCILSFGFVGKLGMGSARTELYAVWYRARKLWCWCKFLLFHCVFAKILIPRILNRLLTLMRRSSAFMDP